MNVLLIAIIAGSISLILRILPVILLKKINVDKFHVHEILDLASSCIIGQIIYMVAFSNRDFYQLIGQFSQTDLLNIVCIILSFLLCYFSKSIMLAIFSVLTIYALIIGIYY